MTDVIIPGATTSTRTLVTADVGKVLFCRVKALNAYGFNFANSNQQGPITATPAAPSILTAPSIANLAPSVSDVLHTTDGTWNGSPAPAFTYEWHRLTVDVPVPPSGGVPSIADTTPQVTEVLHVDHGTWAGSPAPTFTYEWHRLTPDTPVAPSGGTPSIADTTPQVTEVLHVDHGVWAGVPAPTFSYEWHRVTVDVPVPPSGGVPSIADTTPEVPEVLHVDHGTWAGDVPITYEYEWFQVGEPVTITSSASASNVENTVLAHALTASAAATWSIAGGIDASWFEISGSTLRWISNGTRNFEAPGDADVNNAYVVIVRATATTGQTTDQTVTVTVTNVAEATLTFDFTANTSTIAGAAATSTAPLTVTRTGTAFFAERLDGVWTSFGANTARRTDKGLLIEEARTNVVIRNRDLTNASWVKTTCTAAKTQVGIDGVTNAASSITATAANATCLLTTTVTSSARFQTAFIKRITGTGNIQMTMDNGTTWTTLTITSSWARYSIPTQTLANPVVGFRIVTSGDSVAIDMVQNENSGVFATSPIPTTTGSITRASDVVVINTTVAPIASWFNQSSGTFFVEAIPNTTSGASAIMHVDSGTVNDSHFVGIGTIGVSSTIGLTRVGNVAQATFTGTSISGVNKAAYAYELNNFAGTLNGAAITTDTTGTVPVIPTFIRIGYNSPVIWSGYLRKLTYYNGRLSNADLVTLTTP